MYYSAKHLAGSAVRAVDGPLGTVDDFYFDDRTWAVRYIVIAVSAWPSARKVLVSAVSVSGLQPDEVRVNLTKDQIRHSPDVDTHQPISRQKEKEIHDYYVWPYYWTAPYTPHSVSAGVNPNPGFPGKPVHPPQEVVSSEERESREQSNHLRSSQEIIGYGLRARSDDVGHVGDLLLDQESWILRYTVVSLGAVLPRRRVLVCSHWISGIDWPSKQVVVDIEDEIIRNGPGYTRGMIIDREFEARLFDYYRQPRYWEEPVAHR